jgi:hypothetical protein
LLTILAASWPTYLAVDLPFRAVRTPMGTARQGLKALVHPT